MSRFSQISRTTTTTDSSVAAEQTRRRRSTPTVAAASGRREDGDISPQMAPLPPSSFDFGSIALSSVPAGALQPRLTVGAVNDPAEAEAEKVAENVMRSASEKAPGDVLSPFSGTVARAASAPGAPGDLGGTDVDVAPLVAEGFSGGGATLDSGARSFLERGMGGHDFGNVRVHTDSRAARSAESLGAEAYTVGADIAFAPGRYQPETDAGRHLLAHELTHVVQQGGAGVQRKVMRKEGAKFSSPATIMQFPGDAGITTMVSLSPDPAVAKATAMLFTNIEDTGARASVAEQIGNVLGGGSWTTPAKLNSVLAGTAIPVKLKPIRYTDVMKNDFEERIGFTAKPIVKQAPTLQSMVANSGDTKVTSANKSGTTTGTEKKSGFEINGKVSAEKTVGASFGATLGNKKTAGTKGAEDERSNGISAEVKDETKVGAEIGGGYHQETTVKEEQTTANETTKETTVAAGLMAAHYVFEIEWEISDVEHVREQKGFVSFFKQATGSDLQQFKYASEKSDSSGGAVNVQADGLPD